VEILIDLVGADEFGLLLVDERTKARPQGG
jgi:hypothetical protein